MNADTEVANLLKMEENLGKVIQGKKESIRLLMISLLAGGHSLLEDVPGTGKTTLAKSIARTMDGAWVGRLGESHDAVVRILNVEGKLTPFTAATTRNSKLFETVFEDPLCCIRRTRRSIRGCWPGRRLGQRRCAAGTMGGRRGS